MREDSLTHTTRSADETRAIAGKLGSLLQGGELICLEGELGTGKTCWIQGMAEGLGIDPARVLSPTFTIHHEYHGRATLHHLDLYRIEDAGELEKLGLLDLLDSPEDVVVVEWADKARDLLPKERIRVIIEWEDENTRRFDIRAEGGHYGDLLKHFGRRIVNQGTSS